MIKVAIVEDIQDIREGLQLLIDSQDSFSCTHAYATGEEAIANIAASLPDIVLMDIHLPGKSGIETLKILKSKFPKLLFIMSTIYEDDENIFESLKAGASGYLLKNIPPAKIIEAIEEVYNGGSPMTSQIARRVIASFQKRSPVDDSGELTPKEKEIVKALSRGLRYKEIASELNISIDTVRSHIRHIYEKLHVQSKVEAINVVYRK